MYKTKSRNKFSLQAHLIFSTKYRKKLLLGQIDQDIKQLVEKSAEFHHFRIQKQQTDQDHIHILVEYDPQISISQIVRAIKQKTTWGIWKLHDLSKHYKKQNTFWTRSYFACSIGQANEQTMINYIENQG